MGNYRRRHQPSATAFANLAERHEHNLHDAVRASHSFRGCLLFEQDEFGWDTGRNSAAAGALKLDRVKFRGGPVRNRCEGNLLLLRHAVDSRTVFRSNINLKKASA
jgi:hypothetical protein